jgi:hypothetical protein
MAIGVSFAQNDLDVGLPLTSAIALQDIPEGLAVALALRSRRLGGLAKCGADRGPSAACWSRSARCSALALRRPGGWPIRSAWASRPGR